MLRRITASSFLVLCLVGASQVTAQSVGHYCYSCDNGTLGTAIGGAGYTAVDAGGIGAFDFTSVDLFVHMSGSNSDFSTDFTARSADMFSWLSSGGLLMVWDRYVGADDGIPETSWLPWLSFTATRDFSDGADIEVLGTAGAFGTGLTNATLDGGTSSSHGYATGLPGGAVPLLSNSNLSHFVAFYAQVGAGFVFYSTIPMDYYLQGGGPDGVREIFQDYFPQTLDAMFGLEAVESTVPEPATMTLLATGLAGLTAARRRRR